jgi:hypothetical protein
MNKLIILLLLSGPCMAQTYDLTLNLDGVTYQGDFTFTPTTMINVANQLVAGPGIYSNVSISDPYAGTLTSAYDVYDGNNLQQHELWLGNSTQLGWIGINIPYSPGGPSVPVTGALSYFAPGGGYVTCAPCDASITEVKQAPELDPAGGIAATALLGGIILILKARRA